ncbi:cytochrome c3 family protein [uncultured Sutterella sp.]|uniref:cytochrome c3 family protein n=1 Tax=uncultured Sutterella sp. TaxID=286133 RepID=UPI00260B6782|nr:cytochrome c3 family protein [uncultured Sutterella sp.]
MKTILVHALLALLAFSSGASAFAAETLTKDQCLGCHGSFEALISKNVQVEADPLPINPHTYIPHGEKADQNIWECTTCHTPHAMPPRKGAKAEANVDACYQCHHQYTFEKCSACHS